MKKTKTKVTTKHIFKHLFIPHQKNGYRPHAFRHRMLTLYSFALLSSQVLMGITYFSGPSLAQGNASLMKQDIIVLTNGERQKSNVEILKENKSLDQAAELKLKDMFRNNYWDHTSPSGKEPWDFIEQANYEYSYAGENLARGFINAKSVVRAWMESESHKRNILNSGYNEIGLAVGEGKIDGRPTVLVVQMFGTQKSSMVAAAKTEAGDKVVKTSLSQANLTIPDRLPYFVMWVVLFALVIFDGIMLRKTGLHKSKKQLFQFRSALIVNVLVLILLGLNYVSIA